MIDELESDRPLAERLEVARAEPPSPEAALRIALCAALAMRTQEAASALRAAADGASPERHAAVATLVALWSGDPRRALVAAERAPDHPDARALAAEALRLEGDHGGARERVEGLLEVHPFARLVAAHTHVDDEPARTLAMLAGVERGGVLGARARRIRARAWLAHDPPEPLRARDELSAGVWRLARLGAPDELGRAYLLMAEVEGLIEGGAGGSRAASWLARAHPLLTRTGTSFDQALLRSAFRRFGRRAIDRLVDRDLERPIEGFRRVGARATDLSRAAEEAHSDEAARRRLEQDLRDALADLTDQGESLIAALEGALVDKERTGRLVDVVRGLFLLAHEGTLDHEIPRLVLSLGGESATLGLASGSGWSVVSEAGSRPPELGALGTALTSALADGSARVLGTDDRVFGVVPIRAGDAERVLVLRGVGRGGRAAEVERLQVVASVASAAYEQARSAEQLRLAAARDAATLEAIRDAIVTLDRRGRVRAINGAGAALLAVPAADAIGRPLGELPGLAPLAEAAERAVDDETISLRHVDVLARARKFEDGVVLTIQELGRARQLAHKLVGSSARFTFEDLVGKDSMFLDAVADARRVAVADVPILITGESGTGKELLAQAIHNASPRAAHPFVGVNVAAIPRELLESELFGYESGAFTGARAGGHAGRFELAGRGTILLDEIGDMPFDMQAKLLRVLQERSVMRLGGTRVVPVNARVIATTHRDLERSVEDGTFRLDLFYRLRVVHLRLPALRERPSDIALLVEHHLARHAERAGRAPLRLGSRVLAELERYRWPGNVRELANLVEGIASLTPIDAEEITEVPQVLRRMSSRPAPPRSVGPPAPSAVEPLDEVERRAVAQALAAFDGNVLQAAKALGIARGTLYRKMERYGLKE
ncbi:MAG: sigma 54-interacting transcriptional regulator [Sandaracinaceae bacterium]|nr:sigma 54-interacting transcriptional regulator [Sandaracinaceae bacterium]